MDDNVVDLEEATAESPKEILSDTENTTKELDGAKTDFLPSIVNPERNTMDEIQVAEAGQTKSRPGSRRNSMKEQKVARTELRISSMNRAGRNPVVFEADQKEPLSTVNTPGGSATKLLEVQSYSEQRRSVVSIKSNKMKPAEIEKKILPKWAQLTKPLVMVTMITSFGSSLQYGYNLWLVNHPDVLLQEMYNSTYQMEKKRPISKSVLRMLYNLTIMIFFLGGLVGSLLTSCLVDRFGRRGILILNNFLSMVAAVLTGLSAIITAMEYIVFIRLLTGICAGIFSCATPMYLGEVAPKMLRGTVISMSTVFVALGILLAQILSFNEILGTEKGYPILISLTGILALFQFLVLPCFPESPRYLLIQKGNQDKARQALQKLRCQENVEEEMEEICQEDAFMKSEKEIRGFKILSIRGFWWQIILVMVLMGGQQLSGINAANYYAEKIYATMWLSRKEAYYLILMSNLSRVMMLLIVVYVVDTVGRRVLILIGFGISGILCVLLTMTLEIQNIMPWMSYVSSSLIFVFILGHALGPGPIPNVLITELFLQSSRSTAVALGGFVHWLFNCLTGVVFQLTEKQLGSYSFLIFWPFCFGSFLFLFKIIPETKGKSFLEIRRLLQVQIARRVCPQDSKKSKAQNNGKGISFQLSKKGSTEHTSTKESLQQFGKKKKRKNPTKPN